MYVNLTNEVRRHYNAIWKGILLKDELTIKKHAASLGVPMYELFAGMLVGRTWKEIMDKDKGRESLRNARVYTEDREVIKNNAFQWRNEINVILG